MKIKKSLIFTLVFNVVLITASALNALAQYPPGVKARLAGGAEQTINGVIRVPKAFGVIPHTRGDTEPGSPCGQFYVAVLDPDNGFKPITTTSTDKGRDDGVFYTCKFSLTAPANKSLYVTAGLGGTGFLPKTDPDPFYVTDAWVGGTNNKPRRGYERGFAGKYVTLGTTHASYLHFEMYYAQIDPN
jgi:hypothetical protein